MSPIKYYFLVLVNIVFFFLLQTESKAFSILFALALLLYIIRHSSLTKSFVRFEFFTLYILI